MHKCKHFGISLAHINALYTGYRFQKPFLVLEDDVDLEYWIGSLTIPEQTTALYLFGY